MSTLYHAANFFVWRPERAWTIAAIFFAVFAITFLLSKIVEWEGQNIHSWILLVPSVSWTVFGFLEQSSKVERSNIRIDLLVTWPAILGITVICSVWWGLSLVSSLVKLVRLMRMK